MTLREKLTSCFLPMASFPRVSVLLMCVLLCVSCSFFHKEDEHDRVRAAAQEYLDRLVSGDYEGYLSGFAGIDSLPALYRQQMAELAAQYRAELKSKGEIMRATVTRDSLQDSIAYVFVDVLFADSTIEQMGMKMILEGEQWKMR
ncbi:MAG: hypothetical protein ACI4UA_00545 [Bacteroidaceae bacterium]